MTPARIEPATFRFVGQYLNQQRYRVPQILHKISLKTVTTGNCRLSKCVEAFILVILTVEHTGVSRNI
jgi:hypothetical protein